MRLKGVGVVYLGCLRGGAPDATREEAEAGSRGGFVRGGRLSQGMVPEHPFLSPLEHVPVRTCCPGPSGHPGPRVACKRCVLGPRAHLGHPPDSCSQPLPLPRRHSLKEAFRNFGAKRKNWKPALRSATTLEVLGIGSQKYCFPIIPTR